MKHFAVRHLFSLPAAMFYTLTVEGLHENLGSPHGISAITAAFASYTFLTAIGLWVLADARDRRIVLPYDFGSFVFVGWLIVLPFYLWWTRRWRAFFPLAAFAFIYIAAALAARMPHWL